MDPVQLALIILGLVAIGGGVLALIAAIWTLRTRPARPARPSLPPSFARREPTLDRSEQVARSGSSPSYPAAAATPAPAPSPGLSTEPLGDDEDENEDDIPTTVLSASAYANLDEMIAAIDDKDARDSS